MHLNPRKYGLGMKLRKFLSFIVADKYQSKTLEDQGNPKSEFP